MTDTPSQGRLDASLLFKVDNSGTYGRVSADINPQRSDGRREDHFAQHDPNPR